MDSKLSRHQPRYLFPNSPVLARVCMIPLPSSPIPPTSRGMPLAMMLLPRDPINPLLGVKTKLSSNPPPPSLLPNVP